jgi:hypothetical protein
VNIQVQQLYKSLEIKGGLHDLELKLFLYAFEVENDYDISLIATV